MFQAVRACFLEAQNNNDLPIETRGVRRKLKLGGEALVSGALFHKKIHLKLLNSECL